MDAQEKLEQAITAYYAAQAEGKVLNEWLDNWKDYIEASGNDAEAFKARFGSGK